MIPAAMVGALLGGLAAALLMRWLWPKLDPLDFPVLLGLASVGGSALVTWLMRWKRGSPPAPPPPPPPGPSA